MRNKKNKKKKQISRQFKDVEYLIIDVSIRGVKTQEYTCIGLNSIECVQRKRIVVLR